jgi:hypothetical protein
MYSEVLAAQTIHDCSVEVKISMEGEKYNFTISKKNDSKPLIISGNYENEESARNNGNNLVKRLKSINLSAI